MSACCARLARVSTEIPDAESVVGQFWPRHGPYSPERTAGAAQTAAELVRYLNHATQSDPSGGDGLPTAVTAYRTVGGLQAAAGGLEQTLSQLDRHVQRWNETAALYDDTASRDEQAAATARAEPAHAALDDAVLVARSLAHALARVHRELGHLGHHQH